MFPVRCFTCNSVIEHKYNDYASRVGAGETRYNVLESLDVKRICCRRMFLAHVHTVEDIMHYGNTDEIMDDAKTRFICKPAPAEAISCD